MYKETSLYRHFPLLRKDQQFRLLNLLGKGGFAEVWQVNLILFVSALFNR